MTEQQTDQQPASQRASASGTAREAVNGPADGTARPRAQRVVVKIGTSSVTSANGVNEQALAALTSQVAAARAEGHEVIVVTSGAITAGVQRLGVARPTQPERLQALSAIGQIDLMATYARLFAEHGLVAGQVLIAPHDFGDRRQYVHARSTFDHLLRYGVVPVVNENDAVADDAIRYGDNDRIAALVANLMRADLLVLLTDTAGLLTADPRHDAEATLVEEIRQFTDQLTQAAGSASAVGSGGMVSKLAAAKMAAWSGVRAVIAAASRPNVLADAIAGVPGCGTNVDARDARVSARRLWIGFAVAPAGKLTVDAGARKALESSGRSLLTAGVVDVSGDFSEGDAVEIATADGEVFAKGLVQTTAPWLQTHRGKRSGELPEGLSALVVHRDDLVVLTSPETEPPA